MNTLEDPLHIYNYTSNDKPRRMNSILVKYSKKTDEKMDLNPRKNRRTSDGNKVIK